jgi:hypothetical protein
MTYSFNLNGGLIRDLDGACIPADPANSDYAAYLEWVAAGNTATPYTEPLATVIARYSDNIDSLVAGVYSNWSRFQQEYLLRAAAAQAYKDAGYTGDPGTWVTGFAEPAGKTNQEAADIIIAQSVNLNAALAALGALRMRKYEVMTAADAVTAQATYDDIIAKINLTAAAIQ